MPTYERADQETIKLMYQVMEDHHEPLADIGVKVDLLFAYGPVDDQGMKSGPAISHNGYPATGLCRITSLKDRAKGMGDAEIQLDGDCWPHFGDAKRRAILDHELQHLELRAPKEDEDEPRDDLGRPRLKMRKHDHQLGWFDVVARRNGEHSVEVEQARQLLNTDAQLWLPFIGATPSTIPQPDAKEVIEMARSSGKPRSRGKKQKPEGGGRLAGKGRLGHLVGTNQEFVDAVEQFEKKHQATVTFIPGGKGSGS